VDLPLEHLDGTAKSLASAAIGAGYSVTAQRNDFGSVRLTGTMHGWAFSAILRASGGWDVALRRPGWPDLVSDVTALRATFKAQTPVKVGRAA
jgi:hypothetical protein